MAEKRLATTIEIENEIKRILDDPSFMDDEMINDATDYVNDSGYAAESRLQIELENKGISLDKQNEIMYYLKGAKDKIEEEFKLAQIEEERAENENSENIEISENLESSKEIEIPENLEDAEKIETQEKTENLEKEILEQNSEKVEEKKEKPSKSEKAPAKSKNAQTKSVLRFKINSFLDENKNEIKLDEADKKSYENEIYKAISECNHSHRKPKEEQDAIYKNLLKVLGEKMPENLMSQFVKYVNIEPPIQKKDIDEMKQLKEKIAELEKMKVDLDEKTKEEQERHEREQAKLKKQKEEIAQQKIDLVKELEEKETKSKLKSHSESAHEVEKPEVSKDVENLEEEILAENEEETKTTTSDLFESDLEVVKRKASELDPAKLASEELTWDDVRKRSLELRKSKESNETRETLEEAVLRMEQAAITRAYSKQKGQPIRDFIKRTRAYAWSKIKITGYKLFRKAGEKVASLPKGTSESLKEKAEKKRENQKQELDVMLKGIDATDEMLNDIVRNSNLEIDNLMEETDKYAESPYFSKEERKIYKENKKTIEGIEPETDEEKEEYEHTLTYIDSNSQKILDEVRANLRKMRMGSEDHTFKEELPYESSLRDPRDVMEVCNRMVASGDGKVIFEGIENEEEKAAISPEALEYMKAVNAKGDFYPYIYEEIEKSVKRYEMNQALLKEANATDLREGALRVKEQLNIMRDKVTDRQEEAEYGEKSSRKEKREISDMKKIIAENLTEVSSISDTAKKWETAEKRVLGEGERALRKMEKVEERGKAYNPKEQEERP